MYIFCSFIVADRLSATSQGLVGAGVMLYFLTIVAVVVLAILEVSTRRYYWISKFVSNYNGYCPGFHTGFYFGGGKV